MKLIKLAALALTLVMTAGTTGCSYQPAGTTIVPAPAMSLTGTEASGETQQTTVPAATETSPETYAEKPAAEVSDAEDGKLVIWSYDPGFKKILEQYSPVKNYEYVEIAPGDYKRRLDDAFSAGKAPDMFFCGFDNVREFADSDRTLPINDIGISNKSCEAMYDYTLRLACDSSGNIKGLSWDLAPSAVFYQRTLAQQYLGSSDPETVSKSFSSWDSFLTTARKINKDSEGNVKIVSGTDEIFRSYMGNRSSAWKTDGKLNIDASAETYFEYAKTIESEKLTFGASRNSDEWKDGMRNKTVLSYWGPLSLARSADFALDPAYVTKANPTSGDWGIVQAPEAFAWGGTWIMVSSTSDMKKSCAEIINAICCDQDNLKDMLVSGKCDFVNSRTVISSAAADERYKFAWLGNQNPYAVLAPEAGRINVNSVGSDDTRINNVFRSVADIYVKGGFKTVKDAKATFREILIEKRIVRE